VIKGRNNMKNSSKEKAFEQTNPSRMPFPNSCPKSGVLQTVFDQLVNVPLVDPLPVQESIIPDELQMEEEQSFNNPLKSLGPKIRKVGQTVRNAPTTLQQHADKISQNFKSAVDDWQKKTPEEKMQHVHKHLEGALKNVGNHIVDYGKHEYHTYKGASHAIRHLASGKKWGDLHPEHKKHLKDAIIHAGITAGSMALGDASGGGVGSLFAHFATEHAHHAAMIGAGKVAYKSGKDAYNKATSAEKKPISSHNQFYEKIGSEALISHIGKKALGFKETSAMNKIDLRRIEEEAKKIIKILIDADIPPEEWMEIFKEIEKRKPRK
jgi:uncharacterized FlaG/YvyC family protein